MAHADAFDLSYTLQSDLRKSAGFADQVKGTKAMAEMNEPWATCVNCGGLTIIGVGLFIIGMAALLTSICSLLCAITLTCSPAPDDSAILLVRSVTAH